MVSGGPVDRGGRRLGGPCDAAPKTACRRVQSDDARHEEPDDDGEAVSSSSGSTGASASGLENDGIVRNGRDENAMGEPCTPVVLGRGPRECHDARCDAPRPCDTGRAELARRRDARGRRADEEWDADLGGGHGSSVSDPDVVGVSGSSSNRPVGVARSSCASLDRSVPNTSSGGGCGVSMPPGPRREGPWVAVRG